MRFTGANQTEVRDFLVVHRSDPARLQLRETVGTKSGELDLDGKPKLFPVLIFDNQPAGIAVLIEGSEVVYDKTRDEFVVTNP